MNKKWFLSALLLLGATGVHAESAFYVGAGVSVSDALSNPHETNPAQNDGVIGGLGLTAGLRFDAGAVFFGPEFDADINLFGELTDSVANTACADGFAGAPYYCDQSAALRLRGVLGADIGPFEVFGTAGFAMRYGNVATGSDGSTVPLTEKGLTFGMGVQRQVGNGINRAEYIKDLMPFNQPTPDLNRRPTWEADTFKVSYIVSFGAQESQVAEAMAGLSFYAGGGLLLGSADSMDKNTTRPEVSRGNIVGLGGTLGARYDIPAVFFAVEADIDLRLAGEMAGARGSCAVYTLPGPHFCSNNATARLRAMVGKSFGKTEVFGTVGYGAMHGQGLVGAGQTDTGIVAGLTFGAGVQQTVGRGTLRIEYIHDDFANILVMPADRFSPTWRADSFKVSYLLPF